MLLDDSTGIISDLEDACGGWRGTGVVGIEC
jgi:hypothetical protein